MKSLRSPWARVPLALSLMAALALPVAAFAQGAAAYPTKPIRIVVPSAAGGPTDVGARIIGEQMQQHWGQAVVIDNRAGGNNIIGTQVVATAPPDGYTILLALDSTLTMHPSLYPKLPYDPAKDFAPIGIAFWVPVVLIADAAKGPKSLADLIQKAKSKPGSVSYGAGTLTSQLGGELLKSQLGVQMVSVPYKGSAGTTQGLFTNDVDFTLDGATTGMAYIKSGKFRVLANLSQYPVAALPDLPSFAKETGIKDFDVSVWLGFVAPAGTPPAIIARLNEEIARILALPDVRAKLSTIGLEPAHSTPAEFQAFIREESDKWSKVIKSSGFKVD